MAGFPSQYSKELWQQARDLISQGLSFPEVAEKTGIGLSNLKMKSQREEWFVPVTAIQKGKEALAQREKIKDGVCPSVTTEAVLAESIAEMGQKGQFGLLRGLLPKLLSTFSESSPLMQKDITDWKSASSMGNLFAKYANIGGQQQTVQIAIGWGRNGSMMAQQDDQEKDVGP